MKPLTPSSTPNILGTFLGLTWHYAISKSWSWAIDSELTDLNIRTTILIGIIQVQIEDSSGDKSMGLRLIIGPLLLGATKDIIESS